MPLRSSLRRLRAAAIAGTAALLVPAAAQAQQVYLNAPVQLYAGPDMRYPIIATLYPGVDMAVMGCLDGYQWCDVMLPDGQRGWVLAYNLSYPWMGDVLPVPQYGATIGIPLISFIVGDYWGRHYRHQPWYDDYRWRHPPPPPPRVAPMPAPPPWGGWQQPWPPRRERDGAPPPRWEGESAPPPRWERNPNNPPAHGDERWNGAPPRRDFTPPPRPEPGRGTTAPAPAPLPSAGPAPQPPPQPRPEQARPFPPRPERIDAPPPAGGWTPPAPQRQERPAPPQREIALPPRQEREPNRNAPNRPDGDRHGFQ